MNITPQPSPVVREVIVRSLIVGFAYALANALAAAILGSMSRLAPTTDNLSVWFLTGTLTCLSLSPFIIHSNWSRSGTILPTWAVLAFVRSLGLGIEGALFKPTAAVNAIVGAVFGLLVSLLVAWLSVVLLMPTNQVSLESTNPKRSWWGWTWRVLAVGLAYFVFYFIFGATNAFLYTMNFYKNNPQYGLNLPAPGVIFLAQLLKGPLFGLGLLFVAQAVNVPRRKVGVWLGILLFVVGGVAPYVEVTFRTMPLGFNMATLTEVFFQNFLTGIVAAYLYGKKDNRRKLSLEGKKNMDGIFDPKTLAEDLAEVHRIYSRLFAALGGSDWDKPVKGSPKEWDLHEIVAHLVALNGAGLESIKHTLRGEPYTFVGLEDRYKFNAWNRKGIDDHLDIPMKELCTQALNILDEAALIARDLSPDQAKITAQMPIYNRPVSIAEALSIIIFHVGLAHAAQVAEPVGAPPLWLQHSPKFRHRVIGRVMRAFSLLYRLDIGGPLRDTIVFRIDGPDGGEWYVKLLPDAPTSGEGVVEHPGLVIHLRETAVFCQMLTGRFNLPIALISGAMKLRGDLRLFLRMSTLFSIDARPQVVTKEKHYPLPST